MRDLPDRPSLEHYRRQAKELVRALRTGDEVVRERVGAVVGSRGRFLRADAQVVLAREHGCRSWAAFRRLIERSPLDELAALERGEVVVDSGLAYADNEPSASSCASGSSATRSPRGRAIEKSGKPPGWREAAERAVEPMNVDRQGTVFVPTVAGPHLSRFIELLADASRAVHEAVIVLVVGGLANGARRRGAKPS